MRVTNWKRFDVHIHAPLIVIYLAPRCILHITLDLQVYNVYLKQRSVSSLSFIIFISCIDIDRMRKWIIGQSTFDAMSSLSRSYDLYDVYSQ